MNDHGMTDYKDSAHYMAEHQIKVRGIASHACVCVRPDIARLDGPRHSRTARPTTPGPTRTGSTHWVLVHAARIGKELMVEQDWAACPMACATRMMAGVQVTAQSKAGEMGPRVAAWGWPRLWAAGKTSCVGVQRGVTFGPMCQQQYESASTGNTAAPAFAQRRVRRPGA